jgi:hypothetical protein
MFDVFFAADNHYLGQHLYKVTAEGSRSKSSLIA